MFIPSLMNLGNLMKVNYWKLLERTRIRVERAMERIQNYHILGFVPITLCKNDIIDMTFCCLCNAIKLPPTTSRWLAIIMIFPTNVAFMLSIRQ